MGVPPSVLLEFGLFVIPTYLSVPVSHLYDVSWFCYTNNVSSHISGLRIQAPPFATGSICVPPIFLSSDDNCSYFRPGVFPRDLSRFAFCFIHHPGLFSLPDLSQ
ncbi:hypothetical protein CRM22_010849 [Opisthorchis felineus]|uniref:Uncharacterized protein n=1 Tax=Opisthorchis felineus TaxID=147828 RepID=A0A4S2KL13_OPIFE|nr:hypothetical protein CRM22_010849 [Opisthorchis felineus]